MAKEMTIIRDEAMELEKQLWGEEVDKTTVHVIPEFSNEDLDELQRLFGV